MELPAFVCDVLLIDKRVFRIWPMNRLHPVHMTRCSRICSAWQRDRPLSSMTAARSEMSLQGIILGAFFLFSSKGPIRIDVVTGRVGFSVMTSK